MRGIFIHLLYVNWCPTHHQITPREFKNASKIFISKGEEKDLSEFSSDFYLKKDLKHVKNCIFFKLNIPQDCIAILHESGLLLVEVKEWKQGTEEFKDFCDEEYYEPLKDRLHTHMFIHKLSGNFPFCEPYNGNELGKVLQTLHRKYINELKSQINTAKRVHSTYIADLSMELDRYDRMKMKDVLLKWNHIKILRKVLSKRIDLTKVYGFNINLAGVQGFINSFLNLTSPIIEDFEKPSKTAEFAPEVYREPGVSGGKSKSSINKPKEMRDNSEFLSAISGKQAYLHEVGELYSVFGTQTLLIDISFAAIVVSIMGIGLSSLLPFTSLTSLHWSLYWSLVTAGVFYVILMAGFRTIGRGVTKSYRRILKIERIELLAEQEEVGQK